MRKSVKWFAHLMERELRKNDGKGGWADCPETFLFNSIVDNLNQARKLAHGKDKIKACVDMANFAMMIADNEQRRSKP
ncbi:MAG: hypothetical protein WC455_16140 [Dehalococcoidia bacterium]